MSARPLLACLCLALVGLAGCATDEPAPYGPTASGDWQDPSIWPDGVVPDEDDDVTIGGTTAITMHGDVRVRDLTLADDASLTTEPGTELTVTNFYHESEGDALFQATHIRAGYFDPLGGRKLNPTCLEADTVEEPGGSLTMYLGGTTPACPGTGPGHYAAIRADHVDIHDVEFHVDTIYDFQPAATDSFLLIEATDSFDVSFSNVAHGDSITVGGVDFTLFISGGRVRLGALPDTIPPTGPPPSGDAIEAVQSGRWHDPATWGGRVPGANENAAVPVHLEIDMDGDVAARDLLLDGTITTAPGIDVDLADVTLGSEASFTLTEAVFTFDELDNTAGGFYQLISSEASGQRMTSYDWPWFNPSTKDSREIIVQTGVLRMGVAGTSAAGPGATGPGHYSTMYGDTITIDDATLELDFLHGFDPSPGDSFTLIEARQSLDATFANARPGDVVANHGGTDLVLVVTDRSVVLRGVPDDAFWLEGDTWTDPDDWRGGELPGNGDDVVIIGHRANLDGPVGARATAPIGDLYLMGAALHMNKADLTCGTLLTDDDLDLTSSTVDCDDLRGYGSARGTLKMNPSSTKGGQIDIESWSLQMGLGGTSPAGLGATGAGHYASLRGDDVTLEDVTLELEFLHGFQPDPGDSFTIIEADSLDVDFANVAHGDLVDDPFSRVDLVLDISDEVRLLTIPADALWLEGTDWLDPNDWRGGQLPGATDDVVIRGWDAEIKEPIRGRAAVQVGDIYVIGGSLTAIETDLICNNLYGDHADFAWIATTVDCGSLQGWGSSQSTLKMNPSKLFVGNLDWTGDVTFGIGGNEAAGTGTGPGFYATIAGGDIVIDDAFFDIDVLYGYEPGPSDAYTIITGDSLDVSFSNVEDGDIVWEGDDVSLRLNFRSRSVTLEPVSPTTV